MANSLFPAFVRVEYTTAYSAHIMTLPTNEWNDAGGTPDSGEFEAHNASFIEADVMIQDFLTLLAEMFPTTTNFSRYTIFTMASPTAQAVPVYTEAINIDGLSVAPGWSKAVQQTWSFKTTLAGDSKLVLLDAASANAFDKLGTGDFSAEVIAIANDWGNPANAWAGRDGGRPSNLYQIAFTLNEKLRRAYHMN